MTDRAPSTLRALRTLRAASRPPATVATGSTVRRSRRRLPRVLALAALLLAAAAPLAGEALAQKAALQVTQGPYHAGVPIDLQVVADDFDEEPQPEVSAPAPAGAATLQYVQSRPQVSSMMQIINGRITQSRQVRFAYVYQLTASGPGRYTVGPFTVTQGAKTATTRTVTLNVVEIPEGSGQRLRVLLGSADSDRDASGTKVFVGQRVPVKIEWWTEAGLADRLYNQRLSVPVFLDTARFQFLDEPAEPSRIVLNIDTADGTAEFPAEVRQQQEGDKTWVIRSVTRTMVPVAAGRFELGRASLFCEEATSFQRDIFGSRVPSRARRVRISGEPMVLDVEPVPTAGRPASFAGAIGQGFTLEVSADRTVLQAGDPVRLTFVVRGDGSLDTASLPPLASAGLSPDRFRLPEGEVAGITADGAKRFEVNVRVTDPGVHEIPPIEYSWFNPQAGTFETTRSQPIALSVRAATMVGAGDVVSAAPAADDDEEKTAARADGSGEAAARRPAFTLTGADLSIETDVARLASPAPSLLAMPAVLWAGYAGGLLALAGGVLVRRRRRTDPERARLARELRALRSQVASARGSHEVADALRRMAALRGDRRTRPAGLDDALARLDETAYAPGGAAAAIPADVRDTAVGVADAIVEELG